MSEVNCRVPDGHYLIESAPDYRRYLAAKAAREITARILSPLSISAAAADGYQSELRHMLNAAAVYLGQDDQ